MKVVANMKCSECKKLLVDYSDGNLDYQQSVDVQSHLADCGLCRHELDGLRNSLEMLRSDSVLMKEPVPPVNFTERLMGGIYKEEKSYNLFSSNFAMSVAITISILCLGLGLFLNFRLSKETLSDQNYDISEKSVKTELPKRVVPKMENPVSAFKGKIKEIKGNKKTVNITEKKNIHEDQPVNLDKIDQEKIQVKLELVEVLGQTLELIEGDEKEWEIEI